MKRKGRKQSVFMQVTVLVSIIFGGLLFLSMTRDGMRHKIDRNSQYLMTISSCFNDVNIEVQAVRDILKDMAEGSGASKEAFLLAQSELEESVKILANYMGEKEYNRNCVDLIYIIDTYSSDCRNMLAELEKRDYSAVEKAFKNCEQTYVFIQDKLFLVYDDIQHKYVLNQEQIRQYERYILVLNLVTAICVFMVAILLVYWLNRIIIRPINDLSESAERFLPESGSDIQPTLSLKPEENEISILNNSIYYMQKRICEQYNQLIEKAEMEILLTQEKMKVLEHEKWMKDAQLRNLQARINPHFLFNSINLISKMAYMESAVQTSEMLENFGAFLRYNLDNFGKVVTLRKELENTRDYISIQKIRFGDRIGFYINADPTVESAKLPCLILQPLVENAIVHGVGMYTKDAIITVNVQHKSSESVIITVLDNGVGMSQEQIDDILEKIQNPLDMQEDGSIGLTNVFKRLRLFFDDEVSIHMESELEQYTKIEIEIPIIEHEKVDMDVSGIDCGR